MAATLFDLLAKGGPTMIPMAGLSVATVACALERAWFWFQLRQKEERVAQDVLESSRYSLEEARTIAEQHQFTPIGRFLLAPLKLNQPTPETFRLAMEAAGETEFAQMRKGDKLLETIVALAPLLGLLGTVTGLMTTFTSLNIGGGGSSAETSKAAGGIGEALTATASGMVVAILALVAYRISVSLQAQQMDYFAQVGSELEVIYRQVWYEPGFSQGDRPLAPATSKSLPDGH
jgi:biopolymer transport protein ExbB